MYSRALADGEGTVLDFGVSGNLWHGVLVMYDRASGSYWTQLDGRAIDGDHTGRRLAHVPSTFTTWEKWRAAHPDTEVLFKPEDERDRAESAYADYFADPERLFLPHLGEGLGGGVRPKDVVFGVVVDGVPWAVTEDVLAGAGAVSFAGVELFRDPDTGAVHAAGRLKDVRVDRAYWYAWARSHPGSRIIAD